RARDRLQLDHRGAAPAAADAHVQAGADGVSAVVETVARREPRRRVLLRLPRVRPGALGLNLLTYAVALLVFFPILWTVLTAFKTEADAAATPPIFVFQATLDNFRQVFSANYLSY